MARYTKTKLVAGVGVVAGALGLGAFNASFDISTQPDVTNEVFAPHFSYRCMESVIAPPLDIDGELTVAVWNIYKQQRSNWRSALERYAHGTDLVLLQEASLNTDLKSYLDANSWTVRMANAFRFLDTPAGVMNLSRVDAKQTCAYLAMEPWLRLPKSALLSEFSLSNGQTLAVVNLHGVNFALGLDEYKAQLNSLKSVLSKHTGPIILAGDFNTWRQGRIKVLKSFAHSLGLKEVSFAEDQRIRVLGKPLDHLYYRDLRLVTSEAPRTDASDHNPLLATFRLNHSSH
ncbi:endonuclease/exonuclease/phosphatase family protein [Photobacterium leiognathi]|uniref:endonuclease/exonuclease/phosphatase family protein n=1 Tax=Photobacterium leiognathi TaxID=553611 RepID=UPI000D1522BF|nr:endonuclease/exonuclease/phosphatase family protein [Photobacterium leiognathi]PSW40203.1 endonuclease/exonuclease/phosphatase family protein [Photobacterium leiognathi subsp. mandapamensis]